MSVGVMKDYRGKTEGSTVRTDILIVVVILFTVDETRIIICIHNEY
jgi:hypothetical protein